VARAVRGADAKPVTAYPAGLLPRRIAADILDRVLHRHVAFDEALHEQATRRDYAALPDRDRALVRVIAATVLRRLGTLRHLLGECLKTGIPADAPRLETVLLVGAAQILWLDVADHASVDLAVRLARADRGGNRYAGLVNAVLRRIAREGKARVAALDAPVLDTPGWLMARWTRNYGAQTARAIAVANAREPALDFTVKEDPSAWAHKLGGRVLPTGSVRAVVHGPISQLPGYSEGAWWVQDAAAALPARLLGNIRGRSVADLCAAPGGKTAQLAAAAAHVTAVDRSPARIERVRENLRRLKLTAELVTTDILEWQAGPFDAVLLDAPCSSTGTIRRHPDIPWLKRESDIAMLADLQRRLIARAAELVGSGGTLIYCTCSLEPEEGEAVVNEFLANRADFQRSRVSDHEIAGLGDCLNAEGDLRTLPCHLPDDDSRMAGLDGFYAARLERR